MKTNKPNINLNIEGILTSLTEDFDDIMYLIPSTGEVHRVREGRLSELIAKEIGENASYAEACAYFCENFVHEQDRHKFERQTGVSQVTFELALKPVSFLNFRTVFDGDTIYYQAKLVREVNNDGNITGIVIGLHNIDAETRRELRQRDRLEKLIKKESIYKRAIYSDSIGYFECNLTQDLIIGDIFGYVNGQERIMSGFFSLVKPITYSDLLIKLKDSLAAPTVPEIFESELSIDTLIGKFNSGNLMPDSTFWVTDKNGDHFCNRIIFFLSKSEITGDIIGLAVVKNDTTRQIMDDRLRFSQKLIAIMASDFSSLYHVNVRDDLMTPYKLSRQSSVLFTNTDEQAVYTKTLRRYVSMFVVPEDRARMHQASAFRNIIRQLSDKLSFTIVFRADIGFGIRYYEIKFVRIEDEDPSTSVAFGIKDKDNDVRRDLMLQTKLQSALDKATSANIAKSTFLFNMSHDIRTPMNAILGFTGMAKNSLDDPEKLTQYLNYVEMAGGQLLNLINDVLDMSRIESGKISIEEKPVNLRLLTTDIYRMIEPSAIDKQLEIRSDIDIPDDLVLADSQHISRIILNVTNNAIKYTPAGGSVALKLRQFPSRKHGCCLYEFEISDTGIGMSEDYQSHIFESFSRERNTTMSGIEGTGLGMSIVKSLLDIMGGTITIKSRQGEGTVITIRLNLKLADTVENPEEEENAPESSPDRNSIPDISGIRVLVAEDNELNRMIVTDVLSGCGAILDIADDGDVAVEKIICSPASTYDIILMDIQMPRVDGYAATREIRSMHDPARANIPIIAMTANAFSEDRDRAMACGMNDHIAKPIDMKKLIGLVAKLGRKA